MKRETPDPVARVQGSSSSVFVESVDDVVTMDSIRDGILSLKNSIQRWTSSMNEADADDHERSSKSGDNRSVSSKWTESTNVTSRSGKENIEDGFVREVLFFPGDHCLFASVAPLHSKE